VSPFVCTFIPDPLPLYRTSLKSKTENNVIILITKWKCTMNPDNMTSVDASGKAQTNVTYVSNDDDVSLPLQMNRTIVKNHSSVIFFGKSDQV
jgi:hypothetical protein